jgi:hypothetical protein
MPQISLRRPFLKIDLRHEQRLYRPGVVHFVSGNRARASAASPQRITG